MDRLTEKLKTTLKNINKKKLIRNSYNAKKNMMAISEINKQKAGTIISFKGIIKSESEIEQISVSLKTIKKK